MYLNLTPPAPFQAENDEAINRVEVELSSKKTKLSPEKRGELELSIKRAVERWKEGTATLRTKLREWNDMLEGVSEDVDFPWVGASSATMGTAAGMARTFHATMDRNIFDQERVFVAKLKNATSRGDANKLEEAVNWLACEKNNLLSELRDCPIPLFRDGTAPIMGEWERTIEQAVDYKTYNDVQTFQADYPDAESAGISDERYEEVVAELQSSLDPAVIVEFVYDAVTYDGPRFTRFPLSRFAFYPLSAEKLEDCRIYGRQFFQSEETVKTKIRVGEYDDGPGEEALASVRDRVDDVWGYSREQIEGINSGDEGDRRLECYKLVLRADLDGDDIPEKYLLTYEHTSSKILRIERYGLRQNIDCVVLFRLLKRDGRLLGVSLLGDGYDQFRMIDNFHRHRQNVRSLTDSPAFIAPASMKEQWDLGGDDFVLRPGMTFWAPDQYLDPNKCIRQLAIQNLDRTGDSLDEESGVMRYLEMRIGPSQGMSGNESKIDPSAPATKTLALLQQANFRIDVLVKEFKRSVPALLRLHNALYFQYGPSRVKYMANVSVGGKNSAMEMEAARELFGLDSLGFELKMVELAISPEYQMEKVMALTQAAAANPTLAQIKPQIFIELWNMFVDAARVPNPEALKITMNPTAGPMGLPALPGMPGLGGMGGNPGMGMGGQMDPQAIVAAMQGMRWARGR